MATTKTKTIAGTTGGITLAGILIWLASLGGGGSPPPPSPTTRPPATSTTTTVKPPAVSAVKRFGADDASWNQPAARYGPAPDLQEYALRFFDYAGGGSNHIAVLPAITTVTNIAGGNAGAGWVRLTYASPQPLPVLAHTGSMS